MAKCPVCGGNFAPLSGKVIDTEHKEIVVCPQCGMKKSQYVGSLKNNKMDEALEIFSFFNEGMGKNCPDDSQKEIIISALIKMAEPYPEIINKIRERQSEIESEIKSKKQDELKRQLAVEKFKKQANDFMLTSGYDFQGYKIVKYYKVISASIVLGTGMFSELAASISDTFGLRSNVFEEKMNQAKDMAQKKLVLAACQYDANAIIGIDFDYLTLGNNMIAVSANGTVVKIEKE